ncbi:MAG: hypothetical protein FD143_100 [Ignavibacteria bacterium]|nr:MAG: hypothetical protein FD143_100 [Ignavibacteria bacterium]
MTKKYHRHSEGAKLLKNLKQKKQPRVILNPPTADEESQNKICDIVLLIKRNN